MPGDKVSLIGRWPLAGLCVLQPVRSPFASTDIFVVFQHSPAPLLHIVQYPRDEVSHHAYPSSVRWTASGPQKVSTEILGPTLTTRRF
jgi:hypothetical protein